MFLVVSGYCAYRTGIGAECANVWVKGVMRGRVEGTIMQSSLIAELRELKNSKPVTEPPRNRSRMERVMQFEEANGISLAPDTRRKRVKRGGMFDDATFCFPLIDPPNDPSPDKLVQLANGIYSQGGRLMEFSAQLVNRNVKYVLIDRRSDVGVVREALRGRLLYVAIIDYRWVEECLRRLVKVELAAYNLERSYTATEESRAEAKRKLEEDEPNNCRKRAINSHINSTAKKKVGNDWQGVKLEGEQEKEGGSDSDTVVMDELEVKQENQEDQFSVHEWPAKEEENGQEQQEGQEGVEVKIQQSQLLESEIKQEEQMQSYRPEEDSDPDCPSFAQTSKAFQWPEKQEEERSNNSDATEKMDSDHEQPNPTKLKLTKKEEIVTGKARPANRDVPEVPQVVRRKTKLALGSHQFQRNNLICEKLKQMQQIYENTGDRKQYAYLRAIAAIRNYGREIKSADELRHIEGLGRKTIDKIREFLKTGSISKVEQRLNQKDSVPHKELLRVHGIGLNTAEELAHRGIRTLEELRKHEDLLTSSQRMGLKYVDDFEQRIPREKVGRMLETVRKALFYVVRHDGHHEVEAVGSFRRGRATCGDIDILITRKDGAVEKQLLAQLVEELQRRGVITDHLSQPKPFDGKRSSNYMGVWQLEDGVHHRIDLKHYPIDQYAFALLYFTGSDLFNREMRLAAAERGLILGDHGVRRKERNVGKPWRNNRLPVCLTERDIFALLEMEYRAPNQREL